MSAAELQQVEHAWSTMAQVVFVPQNEANDQRLATLLDTLVDTVGEDETHPLASVMNVVGVLIERYEDEHVLELSDH